MPSPESALPTVSCDLFISGLSLRINPDRSPKVWRLGWMGSPQLLVRLSRFSFQEKGYTLYGLKPDPTSGHYKPVHEPVACESFPTVSLQI